MVGGTALMRMSGEATMVIQQVSMCVLLQGKELHSLIHGIPFCTIICRSYRQSGIFFWLILYLRMAHSHAPLESTTTGIDIQGAYASPVRKIRNILGCDFSVIYM